MHRTRNKIQVDCIEHDFNAHQNNDRVLASEYTDQSNANRKAPKPAIHVGSIILFTSVKFPQVDFSLVTYQVRRPGHCHGQQCAQNHESECPIV